MNKKTTTIISVVLMSATAIFLLMNSVNAAQDWVYTIIGGIASGIVSVLGWVLAKLMAVLIFVAGYNKFINSSAVTNGWVIARDVANMFFVVIMLVIAFATILQIESYNYKKWLPKLILMAILINFSKTICGILIDVAQVVMLTFVNSFKDIAAGNLTDMLGIKDWQSLKDIETVSKWEVTAAYILAVIYVVIALITIAAMVGMLVMRIIMIWVYVVLSPFAYLMSAFPGGQKYASQWWGDFTKNLIVGPVLAFFIWLSFAATVDLDPNNKFKAVDGFVNKEGIGQGDVNCDKDADGTCKFGTSELMLKFIISIGMLIGGMKIAQEIGGAAGGVAGKIASKGKGLAMMGAGAVGGFALARATRGAKNVGMAAINQKGVRGALDTIGSQRGVVGQALRFTGIRGLAREGSLTLGRHKLAVEEKAQKKMDAFKKVGATETLTSIASGKAATIGQKAAKKAARKIVVVPEEHFDKTTGAVGLVNATHKKEAENRIKDLDLKKEAPSLKQITQLGKSGINLNNTPLFQRYLQKNAEAAGAYNTGQLDAGLNNFVTLTDRNNQPLTGPGRLGVLNVNSDDVDEAIGRTGNTTYALRTTEEESEIRTEDVSENRKQKLQQEIKYHREQVKIGSTKDANGKYNEKLVSESEQKIRKAENELKELADTDIKKEPVDMKPGSGALSVNSFARGQQSYLGVDFAKLNPEVKKELQAKLKPGQNMQNIKGLSTKNQGEIKKIASSLIGVIDQEIKAIESKGKNINKSDKRRLENLQVSKKKLKNPNKLSHLELINTSAKGYKEASDVKKTIIHEGMHGLGIGDESKADYLTEQAASGSPRDRDEIRRGGNKFYEHLEDKMDIDRGANPRRRSRPVREILDFEEDDYDNDSEDDTYNLRTGSSDERGDNVTNITNVTNVTNSKATSLKEKLKADFQNSGAEKNNLSFLGLYLKNLTSAVNKLNTNISKNKTLGSMSAPGKNDFTPNDDYQDKKDNNLKI